jgi:hypothetical protein
MGFKEKGSLQSLAEWVGFGRGLKEVMNEEIISGNDS